MISGTVNEAEGYVAGFDPAILQNAQNDAESALEDYIDNDLPDIAGLEIALLRASDIPARYVGNPPVFR